MSVVTRHILVTIFFGPSKTRAIKITLDIVLRVNNPEYRTLIETVFVRTVVNSSPSCACIYVLSWDREKAKGYYTYILIYVLLSRVCV